MLVSKLGLQRLPDTLRRPKSAHPGGRGQRGGRAGAADLAGAEPRDVELEHETQRKVSLAWASFNGARLAMVEARIARGGRRQVTSKKL